MSSKQPGVSVNLVWALLKYAFSFGFAYEEMFRAASLSPTILENPEHRMSVKQFNTLWQVIARRVGDEHFGLHLAEMMHHYPNGEIVLAVMMNCPTVGCAMEKLSRYHSLSTDFVQLQLTEQAGYAFYTWNLEGMSFAPDRHQIEAVLISLVLMLRGLTDGRMEFVEARFSHAQPEDVAEHRRLFRCPLVFAQLRNELVIQRKDLALPVLGANPVLLDMLESLAQKRLQKLYGAASWASQVIFSISEQLLRGEKPVLEVTARELTVSPRHLQNKLKEEDITYQALLDQVRKETAIDYLKQPQIPMFDIAFLLGFSDQSAFNHAFKRWTGYTPKEYRTVGDS
jgi:AraC-like DNA-binding protein